MCDKDWAFFFLLPVHVYMRIALLHDQDQKSYYLPFGVLRLAHHDCALISQP